MILYPKMGEKLSASKRDHIPVKVHSACKFRLGPYEINMTGKMCFSEPSKTI